MAGVGLGRCADNWVGEAPPNRLSYACWKGVTKIVTR